jgi:hypothetical protein
MKIKPNLALSSLVIASLLSVNALAKPAPHTWHTVSTSDGAWHARLQMINEGGSFVARDGSALTTFAINPNLSQDFGFIFDADADFNVAYTLTLVQDEPKNAKSFSSKACVYVITASGPAKPDIRASSFNGAKCESKIVHGVGEDFFVS